MPNSSERNTWRSAPNVNPPASRSTHASPSLEIANSLGLRSNSITASLQSSSPCLSSLCGATLPHTTHTTSLHCTHRSSGKSCSVHGLSSRAAKLPSSRNTSTNPAPNTTIYRRSSLTSIPISRTRPQAAPPSTAHILSAPGRRISPPNVCTRKFTIVCALRPYPSTSYLIAPMRFHSPPVNATLIPLIQSPSSPTETPFHLSLPVPYPATAPGTAPSSPAASHPLAAVPPNPRAR